MNWKTFGALFLRDAHVFRRNIVIMLLQNLLQPLLFTFVFGRVLTASGMMRQGYKAQLLPGVMAMSMVIVGVQAVGMVLVADLHFSHEIEDRLLAPIESYWVAIQKILVGMFLALAAGLVVIPMAWLVMGGGTHLDFGRPWQFALIAVLVATMSASGGLMFGSSIQASHVGVLFSLIITPMMMFGCAYYPWSALHAFPVVQYGVLINPLVYASEGLRGALAPQVPHMPLPAVLAGLVAMDTLFITVGIRKFLKATVS